MKYLNKIFGKKAKPLEWSFESKEEKRNYIRNQKEDIPSSLAYLAGGEATVVSMAYGAIALANYPYPTADVPGCELIALGKSLLLFGGIGLVTLFSWMNSEFAGGILDSIRNIKSAKVTPIKVKNLEDKL